MKCQEKVEIRYYDYVRAEGDMHKREASCGWGEVNKQLVAQDDAIGHNKA